VTRMKIWRDLAHYHRVDIRPCSTGGRVSVERPSAVRWQLAVCWRLMATPLVAWRRKQNSFKNGILLWCGWRMLSRRVPAGGRTLKGSNMGILLPWAEEEGKGEAMRNGVRAVYRNATPYAFLSRRRRDVMVVRQGLSVIFRILVEHRLLRRLSASDHHQT